MEGKAPRRRHSSYQHSFSFQQTKKLPNAPILTKSDPTLLKNSEQTRQLLPTSLHFSNRHRVGFQFYTSCKYVFHNTQMHKNTKIKYKCTNTNTQENRPNCLQHCLISQTKATQICRVINTCLKKDQHIWLGTDPTPSAQISRNCVICPTPTSRFLCD